MRKNTESQFAWAMLTFSCEARSISSESKAIFCAKCLEESAFILPFVTDDFVKLLMEDDGSDGVEVLVILSSPDCSKLFGRFFPASRLRS